MYNKILKKYQEQENINVFEVENEIDKLYFETLYDTIKKEANLKKIKHHTKQQTLKLHL